MFLFYKETKLSVDGFGVCFNSLSSVSESVTSKYILTEKS